MKRLCAAIILTWAAVIPFAGAQAQATAQTQGGSNIGRESPPPSRNASHSDEHIIMPKFPSGWTDEPVQPGIIEVAEFVPHGQSAADWRNKITLEIHHDSNTLPIDAFQRRALAGMRENCSGIVEGRLQTGMSNGFPTAFWILGCKKDSRGAFGEVRYTKAVQGAGALYLLSWSWRTQPFPNGVAPVAQPQIDEAMGFLTSSVICANDAAHPCPGAPAAK